MILFGRVLVWSDRDGHIVSDVIEPAVFHGELEHRELTDMQTIEWEGQDRQVILEGLGHRRRSLCRSRLRLI